jgi:hypothetical protein
MLDSLESEQLDFLLNILQSVSDSNSDPNVVYPLLKQNLTLLNDRLIEVLNVWVRSTSTQVHRTAQKSIARTLSDFGDLIEEFPLGNKAVNMELSIVCYGLALEIFTVVEDAEIWAYIQSRLGAVYKNRITGRRADNLEQSIEFHRAALAVLVAACNHNR